MTKKIVVDNYINNLAPIKNKWIAMDNKLRIEILSLLPKSKRNQFEHLDTDDLFSLARNLITEND